MSRLNSVRLRLALLTGVIVFIGYAVVAFALVWWLKDAIVAQLQHSADISTATAGEFHRTGAQPATPTAGAAVTVRFEQALSQWGRVGVLTTAPIAGLATGLIAWVAAGRALRPVDAIERRFRELASGDFSVRVPQPSGGDEVARLARTMNTTLDRLEESAQRQRRFVADAAHELRGPIGAVRADLEVAATYPDRVDTGAALAEALIDVERLQTVATDLLTLARLEAEQPALATELSVCEVVRGLTTPQVGRFAVDGDLDARVHGSRSQLTRLLQNLVDNAARHAASTVTISVTASSATVTIDVDDDGPGIPVDQRERVFARFYRLDEARSRDQGGSGLGLAIVAEIARAHRGSVQVDDSPLGGTRIHLALPAAS